MGTKMFKKGSFEEELASSMEKGLISSQLENSFSFDKIAKVADYLSAAAELLDDTGHAVEADMVTKVLARLAGEDTNDAAARFEPGDLLEEIKDETPEEFIIEPLKQQDLFVAPKKNKPGSIPLTVDYKTREIIEDPEAKFFGPDEYLEFKAIAQALNSKLAKKKA